jgi:hypothetical protein
LPTDQITFTFHTPLRLIDQDRLVKNIALRPLIQRLMRRLDDLSRAYGDGPLTIDFRGLLEIAEQVTVTTDQTRWIDVVRGTELEFVIMVIAVSCVKLLSAHNSTQHTSRKHKV